MAEQENCPRCGLDLKNAQRRFADHAGRNREEEMQSRTVQKGQRFAVVPQIVERDGQAVEVWGPPKPEAD